MKMMEGSRIEVSDDWDVDKPGVAGNKYICTDNILFVCGGAFAGLEKIIAERLNRGKPSRPTVGFGAVPMSPQETTKPDDSLLLQATVDDLRQFGMMGELLGRLPNIAALTPLTAAQLVRILREPRNSLLGQYRDLLALSGVALRVTNVAVKRIAEEAMRRKTGARGLRGILEDALSQAMFDAPDSPGGTVVLDVRAGWLVTRYIKGEAAAPSRKERAAG